MPNGMTPGQKCRTSMYLEEFKEENGGCVICGRKISDYYCAPADSEQAELRVYGSCAGHAMLGNSDDLLDQAVDALLPNAIGEKQGKPHLMIVVFNTDGEELKYATQPRKN